MLQEGMKSHDSSEDPYSIPPLGLRYSKRWAIEDLHSEQSESSRLGHLADPLSSSGKGKKAWREEEAFQEVKTQLVVRLVSPHSEDRSAHQLASDTSSRDKNQK